MAAKKPVPIRKTAPKAVPLSPAPVVVQEKSSNLPFPALSPEEQRTIIVMSRYRESFSYADIADKLNEIFKDYNHGCRTREGVKKFLAKLRGEQEVQDGTVQAKAA